MSKSSRLVWIDLEMTGLNPKKDVILEIASIITDTDLNIIEQGPELVIHHPETILATMNEWSYEHHMHSGLTQKSRTSTITLEQATTQTFDFIKKHCLPHTGYLAGNSIWQDRRFLTTYMPDIVNYMHYRMIDVTTVKELVSHWYPQSDEFEKKDTHRALQDLHESITELKYYRENFFV